MTTEAAGRTLYDVDPVIARWLWHPMVANAATREDKKQYAYFLDYYERQQRQDERVAESLRANKTAADWAAWVIVETYWFVRYTLLAPWLKR